jgi:putative ABC transport system permease protein
MKNKTYLKASFREIKQSKGRFIAIIMIVLLGTLLYVGVKTAGPVMQKTMDHYVTQQHLSDLQIISTAGLSQKDLDLAKEVPGAEAEAGYQFYYADAAKNEVVQVFSYDADAKQNQLTLAEGSFPKEKNQIVLDEKAKTAGYKIGDKYQVKEEDMVDVTEYTITGFVRSPLFINKLERGYTNIGNGSVDYFAYIPKENFTSDNYSVLYLSFGELDTEAVYSDSYQEKMDEKQDLVEKKFDKRPAERLAELQSTASDALSGEKQKIADGREQLEQARTQSAAFAQADPSITASLDQQEAELDAAQEKITAEEQKIADLAEPSYLYRQRSDNVGFQEYGDLADRIAAIANVFPLFFFFIAALITFTTMTRMVEENRSEIGMLKALGYTKFEISKKYIIYALLASILGVGLGVVLGTNLLPRIIFELSSAQYDIGEARIFYDWVPIAQASAAFLAATFGSALIVLLKELRERPATLLQPKAPKPGKRILLEYIKPLWSRLSFNQKISYRNLFRYKSRMFMAIVGIAGCAGLMIAGVGLKDSLSAVGDKQFGPITDYQAIVTANEDADNQKIEDTLSDQKGVTSWLPTESQTMELRKSGTPSQNITMFVPEDIQGFDKYVHLEDLDGTSVDLPENGAVITEKVADTFGVKAGEKIALYDTDQNKIEVTIKHIVRNYLGNFIYLSQKTYEQAADKEASPNAFLVKTEKMTKKEEESLSKALLDTKEVSNTSFISKQIEVQEESMANLDVVVLIFVVLSGLLAFIVLYNLTNINISERVRELSTIKVLGFFDKEVTMYIVRENIIFTILGIVGGVGVGYVLTDFILQQASMENVIFPLIISWQAYVLSASLTILFTVIVMIVTHFKLKHINMIDALKSNE